MKLTRLKISNHSRVADTDIEVREHLVLVGPNDVGKSSILRCLDLLLGASTAQLYARIVAADLRDTDQPFVVEAVIEEFAADDEALFPDEITVDTSTGTSSLTIRLAASFDDNETLEVERKAPGGGTGRQISRDQLVGIGWKMLGAVAGARDIRDDRKSPLDDILQAIDLGAEKADFDGLTEQLQKKLAESKILETLRADLAGQLSKALPAAIGTSDLTFVPGASADNDVLSDVRLHVTRAGSRRSLTDQSDGTRALFAIALYDLVSAGANMVGIDEPEIHLHPTSQRSLAKLLQGGSNQKFIATHSADIVGAFSPECIATVKPGGVVVQPQLGFLSADERMAIRWWVRDRLEPLTAGRVVAVEGISDRIILERAADLTGRELDRLGVSLVETGGSGDMGAIIKLFGPAGFDVAMSMLIDADAATETAKKLVIPEADLAKHSTWVSSPDLESEYVSALGAADVWTAIDSSGLFSANELANCATSGPGGIRTPGDVAAFCRFGSKYKVKAAMAVAPLLDDASARRITSIENLLSEIASA